MSKSVEWVFAYGSNMNIEDLQRWFDEKGHRRARIARVERATLPDYRLVWNYHSISRDGGAANVERAAGQSLPGVALDVNPEALSAIDEKEGHPRYYSRGSALVPVELAAGPRIEAWLYVALPKHCSTTTVYPRCSYLEILIRASEAHGLPADHVAMLRAMPTKEDLDG